MKVLDYIAALKRHDWFFDYSEDRRVWLKGQEELDALRIMQRELDSSYAIWNLYAPIQKRIK